MNAHMVRIVFNFAAITGCFCIYSLIQERLMTVGFGPEKEVFKYSIFVVFVNRLVTCAVAIISLGILGQPMGPSAPLHLFAVPSLANVVGSSAQYEALKYVSFPLQALAKCVKSVPVMAWSLLTNTRTYHANDYLSALTVTFGCMLFVLTGDITAPRAASGHDPTSAAAGAFTVVGLSLLAIFMVFDGLTCTSQDKLFSSYNMHSCNQLLYTSAWSALFSTAALVATMQGGPALSFVMRHPQSLWLMLIQSAVSATVQLFIVFTIKQYGALNFALLMTVRQFLSIVLSCIIFQHTLSGMQWLGTLLVIGGLVVRSVATAGGAIRASMFGQGSGGSHDIVESPTAKNTKVINRSPSLILSSSSPLPSSKDLLDLERQSLLRSQGSNGSASVLTPAGKKGGVGASRTALPLVTSGPSFSEATEGTGNLLQSFGDVLTSPLRGALLRSNAQTPSTDQQNGKMPSP